MSKEDNNKKDMNKAEKETANVKKKSEAKSENETAKQQKSKAVSSTGDIEAKLTKLQDEKSALEDKFLRSQAEMQNMQNRYNNERAQLIKYESQSLAKDVLPAMDNLERALATKVDDEASKQLKKGVQMTLDSLVKAMKDHGISEIVADGVKFDPNLHQAVQTVDAENDEQKDHVVQVLQKGYLYKDRTLRPAMVVVAQ